MIADVAQGVSGASMLVRRWMVYGAVLQLRGRIKKIRLRWQEQGSADRVSGLFGVNERK